MESKIKKVIAEVLETNESLIDENASPETIERWDSLKHMNLIVALEEEFGIEFDDDDIIEMISFKNITRSIQKYAK